MTDKTIVFCAPLMILGLWSRGYPLFMKWMGSEVAMFMTVLMTVFCCVLLARSLYRLVRPKAPGQRATEPE